MNRGLWGLLLFISWLGSILLTVACWPVIAHLDVVIFDAWVWFVMLFCLNWLAINVILTSSSCEVFLRSFSLTLAQR